MAHPSRITVLALAAALALAACSSTSSPPTTQSGTTTAPRTGLPGAVNTAEDAKDETNEKTRQLQEQVDQLGK